MPPRKRRDVESGLLIKGFQSREGDHHFFTYHRLSNEKKTSVFTKTSHAASKQCKLSRKDFLMLVDCPLDRNEYERKLVAAGAIVPVDGESGD